MGSRHVLITGGAGFVGANLAVALAERYPDWHITACDNLRRRGSELNVSRVCAARARFLHADVRDPGDLAGVDRVDAVVECSAEPSVLAGANGAGTDYLVRTNVLGAHHCLELARRDGAQFVFLSTSRVYPVATLEDAPWEERETRFQWTEGKVPGLSPSGVTEDLPLRGARTLYGATKLSAEHLVEEYAERFGLATVVNRCGVIAGPWQMGKVDQGVFTHWLLSHCWGRPLRYIGYGGGGKQVRDLLHIDDLIDLIVLQLGDPEHWRGMTFNVGGGRDCSLSLLEATALCRELTGADVPINPDERARPGDLRIYLSDCARLFAHTDWRPRRTPRQVLTDTLEWIRSHEVALRVSLGEGQASRP